MALQYDLEFEKKAVIRVVGIGGGGNNAINRMVQQNVKGVEFLALNTDSQALATCDAAEKVQIGVEITRGLGAGGDPEIGRQAIEENREQVSRLLDCADMVFITCGMGGGTGTGAAPVVAEIARAQGALTVGIVTKPFDFEGAKRIKFAKQGIEELKKHVDTLIVIPNQQLLSLAEASTTLLDAFLTADDILCKATSGISDLITVHGMINVDFADVRTIMSEGGDALMGTGVASGDHRAEEAARLAIHSPLLEDVDIQGARGVLINITCGSNLTLFELQEAMKIINSEAGSDAMIIMGTVIDDNMNNEISITVIATGLGTNETSQVVLHETDLFPSEHSNLPDRDPRQETQRPVNLEQTDVVRSEEIRAGARNFSQPEPILSKESESPRGTNGRNRHKLDPACITVSDDLDKPAFLRRQID